MPGPDPVWRTSEISGLWPAGGCSSCKKSICVNHWIRGVVSVRPTLTTAAANWGLTLYLPKMSSCRSGGVFVFVEDAAEAVMSVDV